VDVPRGRENAKLTSLKRSQSAAHRSEWSAGQRQQQGVSDIGIDSGKEAS